MRLLGFVAVVLLFAAASLAQEEVIVEGDEDPGDDPGSIIAPADYVDYYACYKYAPGYYNCPSYTTPPLVPSAPLATRLWVGVGLSLFFLTIFLIVVFVVVIAVVVRDTIKWWKHRGEEEEDI